MKAGDYGLSTAEESPLLACIHPREHVINSKHIFSPLQRILKTAVYSSLSYGSQHPQDTTVPRILLWGACGGQMHFKYWVCTQPEFGWAPRAAEMFGARFPGLLLGLRSQGCLPSRRQFPSALWYQPPHRMLSRQSKESSLPSLCCQQQTPGCRSCSLPGLVRQLGSAGLQQVSWNDRVSGSEGVANKPAASMLSRMGHRGRSQKRHISY